MHDEPPKYDPQKARDILADVDEQLDQHDQLADGRRKPQSRLQKGWRLYKLLVPFFGIAALIALWFYWRELQAALDISRQAL